MATAAGGHDRDGPLLAEGRFLLGHKGQQLGGWPGAADGSFEGQHVCGSRFAGQDAPWACGSGARSQVRVDLAGDVTLEAADDLLLRQAFRGAPLNVGAGRGVGAHPRDHDPPQGVVGLAVPAAVDSRCRLVLPEDAGMGATAHMCAQAASLRSRSGWSPAAMSSIAAVSGPTPWRLSRAGARAVTSGTIRSSRRSIGRRGTPRAGRARAVRCGASSQRRHRGGGAGRRRPWPGQPGGARRTRPAARRGRSRSGRGPG
jgi:hypothetical protein